MSLPPSREDHEPPPPPPPRYNYTAPYLNPRGYFCGPAASALLSTLFLIVTLAATTLLFSNARARKRFSRLLLSLAFVIPSLERLTNLGELERETESGELSDWIVSSIYTTFGSPDFSLSFAFSFPLSRERESTRSIYVPISRTGAF